MKTCEYSRKYIADRVEDKNSAASIISLVDADINFAAVSTAEELIGCVEKATADFNGALWRKELLESLYNIANRITQGKDR